MLIREHVFTVTGRCIWCGGYTLRAILDRSRLSGTPGTDERTCIERDDGVRARDMRPEPTRRQVACEDADTISRRMAEIRAEMFRGDA